MARVTIKTTNCTDCVFNTPDRDSAPYCKLDKRHRELPCVDDILYFVSSEIPEWCPISNEGEILIKFK